MDPLKRFTSKRKTTQEQGIGWGESLGEGSEGGSGGRGCAGGVGMHWSPPKKNCAGARNRGGRRQCTHSAQGSSVDSRDTPCLAE